MTVIVWQALFLIAAVFVGALAMVGVKVERLSLVILSALLTVIGVWAVPIWATAF